jgi:hypothetical protein
MAARLSSLSSQKPDEVQGEWMAAQGEWTAALYGKVKQLVL